MTREELLRLRGPELEAVQAFGGTVHVRGMDGFERDEWEGEWNEAATPAEKWCNARARMLVRCICDESGKLLLERRDAVALGHQPVAELDRLFQVACRLSGVRETKQAAADAEKNSDGHSDDSSSG